MLTSTLEAETKILNTVPAFHLSKSLELSNQSGAYIYDIAINSDFQLAASLSDNIIKVIDPENLNVKYSWKAHKKKISDLKFNPSDQQHLLSSSLEGSICLWDLRCSIDRPTVKFEDVSPSKPITCFDIDCSGSYICSGTELIHEDAYILFWDIRKVKILGGYWNSHFGEISQVKFHSSQQNWMISGSWDGLINLFDISKSCEDDALVTTLNTECSIYKLEWFPESKKLACITCNQDLQVWNINDAAPCQTYSREKLTELNEGINVDYLVNVIKFDSTMQFMSGSYSGVNSLWEICEDKCQLLAVTQGKEDVVIRACVWNDTNSFIMGGENGEMSIWNAKDIINSTTKQKQEIQVPNVDSVENNNEMLPSDSLKALSSLKKQLKNIKPYERLECV